MLHKSFDILDAKADSEAGTFEATVAVFGNIDKIGDRILPGAFKNTLAKWQSSGDPIPVILSHQWDNPMAHIGVVNEAVETEKGLFVKGTLDVKDNDVARQVHRLMKRRSLKEFSFGYSVPKGGQKRAKDGANDLTEIELAEVGPTLKGMNPATELHAVKSALDEKASAASMAARMRAMADEMDSDNPPDPKEMARRMRAMASQMAGMGMSSDPDELRKQAERVAREEEEARIPTDVPPAKPTLVLHDETHQHSKDETAGLFPEHEAAALKSGELKAVWTTAYINDLPDSAFLHIEPGGNKDADGKTTPRSLRHFPYKDANGAVDLPHLRNALSRIPQSSLPQDVKDRLTSRAQSILDNAKSVDVTDKETRSRSVDPLRKQADDVALEFASDGASRRKAPKHSEPSRPEPELELADLKRRMREEILVHLSGGIPQ